MGRDAYVIYKLHPDLLTGHRSGSIGEQALAELADSVETKSPMAVMISTVDELHVNTPLAGFAALMRGKPVAVHVVPLYAGSGLTTDLGPVSSRRTLDELLSASLILYLRYLDPETRLLAPDEMLAGRLSSGTTNLGGIAAAVVAMRRVLGRMDRLVHS